MSAPATGSNAAVRLGSRRAVPRAVGGSDRRVHPRHFHAGPNPAAAAASSANGDAAAAEADHLPPAARLYRHALESIFGWLNQRELATALQVSKSWLAAAKSMGSLQLTVTWSSSPMCVVAVSAMGHHVTQIGSIGMRMPLTTDSIFIAAQHMPQLRGLSCQVELPSQGLLTFPPGLRLLHLGISDVMYNPTAANLNAVLKVISRLPVLERLFLALPSLNEQLSFAPLASLPELRQLNIAQPDDNHAPATELSDAQVAELRAMPRLHRLEVWPMPTSLLRRLLAQPHDLQWQKIIVPDPLSDEAAALLPQLPSLTSLVRPFFISSCTRFDFLRQLPNLTHIFFMTNGPSVGRIESLVAELPRCSQIQVLELDSKDLTAAHLNELLPRLPRMHTLFFRALIVETLAFLAQEPMANQLTFLQLANCKQLPLTELRHVHALKCLKTLYLSRSFDSPMDAHCQSLYTPPSLLLPRLDKFTYVQP